ncbi:TonB-dependent receptor plug domain-containing protein [Sphingobacterium oryzagri]|uniref:TonB-dependent receptor plug domain-containing protein n=1 Tax=Sphingobacterium oryzagri TaxID=3025669 RepID=A0ABY7WIU3_9SPHI|nr:TonB-dependent receptor plug domain-containing protein [Sphingobacterium sp. KACC 22765]WDF69531.1 TonB-dependent receptor plug domain-containing protein [Sphingobacterium sp. KACC 22765]
MHSLLAYIVQVNILLAIVYGGYMLLLKNLTFYQLNRVYFLSGVLFALIYPFLDIRSLFQQHIEPVGELIAFLPDFYLSEEQSIYTVENLLYVAIGTGVLVLLIKFCVQLVSLFRIHLHSVDASWKKYLYRNVLFPIVPFSFLNKIYLNKEQHQELELQDIFEHEAIHVKGLHTMDILLFELILIGCWYNPFVWLMRSAIRQNLEFLTDQQVLSKGVDRQTYQYSLLHVSKQGASVGISNQFNFKLLKKRIMMMNRRRSSKLELGKYACLLPIIIFSAGAFTVSKADPTITEAVNMAKELTITEIPNALHIPAPTAASDTISKNETVQTTDSTRSITIDGVATVSQADANKSTRVSLDSANNKKALVFINGANSLPPLIYIDGIEQEIQYDLNRLNANDIHSIEVIKDAQTIATKRSNGTGIIKVTTKAAVESGKVDIGIHNVSVLKTDTIRTRKPQTVVVKGRRINEHDFKGLSMKESSLGKDPLIVLDGVAVTNQQIGDIQPDNIESISVLRDASSVAVYGSRGADGVILITTKAKAAGVGKKTDMEYTDDDVFFIDGRPVSKNQFTAVPKEQIKNISVNGDAKKAGRRVEIKTR